MLKTYALKFRSLALPNRGFRMESIAKFNFSLNSFLMDCIVDFLLFFEASGAVFQGYWALKTGLKMKRFLVEKRILSS